MSTLVGVVRHACIVRARHPHHPPESHMEVHNMGEVSNVSDVGDHPYPTYADRLVASVHGLAFEHRGETLFIDSSGKFADGTPAIRVVDIDGVPYARISVSMPDVRDQLPRYSFWAKTYSENVEIAASLLASGIFLDTGVRLASGFVMLPAWTITNLTDSESRGRALLGHHGFDTSLPQEWVDSVRVGYGFDARGQFVMNYRGSTFGTLVPLTRDAALLLRRTNLGRTD